MAKRQGRCLHSGGQKGSGGDDTVGVDVGISDVRVAEHGDTAAHKSVRFRRRQAKLEGVGRPDLQGMRAVAVLTVFLNHLFDWPSGGFVGVDVFFVLSGFFITGILIRERISTRRISFSEFYARRVRRILPSAVLVLVVTVLAGYVVFPAPRARETLIDALYAAVFASNFRSEAVGADYFQEGRPPSAVQHYWSLSIEEQFYFVWPALIALVFVAVRRRRRRGNTTAGERALLIAMGAIVAASFGWAMFLSHVDPNRAYFSSLGRTWELGVGALVAIAAPWLLTMSPARRKVLAYAGLAGVAASMFVIDPTVQFPAPWAALPVLATALVVASFHGAAVEGVPILTNPVARWVGDRSYTLYLWHWPVIIVLTAVMAKGPVFYGLAVALSLALTAVTYRFYEDPIRKSDWLTRIKTRRKTKRLSLRDRRVWAAAGGFAAVVVLFAIFSLESADRTAAVNELIRAEGKQTATDVRTAAPKVDPCFGAPAMLNPKCALRDPDVPLAPPVDLIANDTQLAFRCFRQKTEFQDKTVDQLEPCFYGYAGPDVKRIALVGDSHAAHLLPALWPTLESNKWSLTTYIGWHCNLAEPLETECKRPMDKVMTELLTNRYDLVLVTGMRIGHGMVDGYQRAWSRLAAAGSRVAVVVDNPQPSDESLACVTRPGIGGDHTGDCGTPRSMAFAEPDPLVLAAQQVPGTFVIDLTPHYCRADQCPAVIGNVVVFRDSSAHITATFAQTLASPLADGIRRALAAPPPPRVP